MGWPGHVGEGVVWHGRDSSDLLGSRGKQGFCSLGDWEWLEKWAWGQQPGLELYQKAAWKAVMLLRLGDPTLPKGEGFQGRFHHRLSLELI